MNDYRKSDYNNDYEDSYIDYYDENFAPQPKRHRFAKGFVCGFLLTFLVFATVIMVGIMLLYRSDLTLGVHPAAPEISSQTERFDRDAVEEKLNLLGMYVDQVYLYDYDEEQLAEGLYKGYMSALGDPYTVYYTEEEYASMMESTEGSYYGIGVQVRQSLETGLVSIVRVFRNSPAMEAGLQAGDLIYTVGGEEVTGMDLNTVVTQIKGREGTTVPITVYRQDTDEYLDFHVERRQVEMDTVEYRMLEQQVGYILILEFEELTAGQFREAVADLQAQGMESLIVDVRNNPGGLVSSVVDIADELVPKGLIVYLEDKHGLRNEYEADDKYLDIPLVLLVNEESASASEILAGAVRDRGVGTLVGTNTFGKGIAQSIYPLGDGTALKITTADYYTPSGENIHRKGIAPDVEVEQDADSEEDTQLQAAWELLVEQR